jgi:hypothetical protein
VVDLERSANSRQKLLYERRSSRNKLGYYPIVSPALLAQTLAQADEERARVWGF